MYHRFFVDSGFFVWWLLCVACVVLFQVADAYLPRKKGSLRFPLFFLLVLAAAYFLFFRDGDG